MLDLQGFAGYYSPTYAEGHLPNPSFPRRGFSETILFLHQRNIVPYSSASPMDGDWRG